MLRAVAIAAGLTAWLLGTGCGRGSPRDIASAPVAEAGSARPPVETSGQASARPPSPVRAPALTLPVEVPLEPRTTDGTIAAQNLDAQIDGFVTAAEAQGAERLALAVAPLYAARAQFLGRVDDLVLSLAATERVLAAAPEDPEALLAHAGALAGLHRFGEATAVLTRAERVGADATALLAQRAAISEATGRDEAALALRRELVTRSPTLSSLGGLAALEHRLGHTGDAAGHFAAARAAFADVSPFPLAWLDFQEAQAHERSGDGDAARALYARALRRLPGYAAAASHLAALLAQSGEPERALALLEALPPGATDPELVGQRAELCAKLGRGDEARALITSASRRYDALLAQAPAAFADHAARFWLGPGGDPRRAASLARQNLAVRTTDDAFALAIDASLAAGEPRPACALADRALAARPAASKALLAPIYRAYVACGRAAAARAVDVRL
jgi:tetratricopeptide (TPR) repeat protein